MLCLIYTFCSILAIQISDSESPTANKEFNLLKELPVADEVDHPLGDAASENISLETEDNGGAFEDISPVVSLCNNGFEDISPVGKSHV